MGIFTYSSKMLYQTIAVAITVKLVETQMNIWIGTSSLFSAIKYSVMIVLTCMLLTYVRKNHQTIGFIRLLFILWVAYLIVTARPFFLNPYYNHLYFKQFLSNYLFLYMIPLYMIIRFDLDTLRKIFKLSYIFVLIYLTFAIPIFLTSQEMFKSESMTYLLGGSLILMMTFSYHNIKKGRVIIATILIGIVIMMLLGRRNVVLYLGGGMLLAGLLNVFGSSTLTTGKKYRYVFILTAIACVLGMSIFSSSFAFFFERVESGMNSRESIIDLFVYDFNNTPLDWIFGRGIYGEFGGGILATNEESGMRDGIENGYLMLILKGGCIWLGLIIMISLKAVYLGLFKSKNNLCKGFACIILLYYIDMIGFGVPGITLKYIMIFIGISVCNTKYLRECTDDMLAEKVGLS